MLTPKALAVDRLSVLNFRNCESAFPLIRSACGPVHYRTMLDQHRQCPTSQPASKHALVVLVTERRSLRPRGCIGRMAR